MIHGLVIKQNISNLLFQLLPIPGLLQLCSQIFLSFFLSHLLFSVMSPPHGPPDG